MQTGAPEVRPVYFDASRLPTLVDHYVCWVDVMGSANSMARSLPTAANFICKLHCAGLQAYQDVVQEAVEHETTLRLYPVIDGIYVTARRKAHLMPFLSKTLRPLAETFLQEHTQVHRFLVRGAIAYGPVVHGHDLEPEASRVLDGAQEYRDSILMGLPMAQAYLAEPTAPPYGIAVHESARAFAPEGETPFQFLWWDWYRQSQPPLDGQEFLEQLRAYFAWFEEHTHTTGYDVERIKYHRELAKEYFVR